MKNKVALIYGGMGSEHDISLMSAEFVLRNIDCRKFDPLPVLITKEGEWLITDRIGMCDRPLPCYPARFSGGSGLMTPRELIPLLCAFPVLHGNLGEDGIIQGALECAGIPYIGCRTESGALSADKAVAKTLAESVGIPTSPFVQGTEDPTDEYIAAVKRRAELLFGYPMFIKPSNGGSSIGASLVRCRGEFESAYLAAARYGTRVIVEEAQDVVCELECAVFIDKSKEIFTKIGTVSNTGDFYDYKSKYESDSATVSVGRDIDKDTERAVAEYARSLVRILSIRQLSRMDFFLTRRGEILFNEVNTLPGLTENSLYPRLLNEMGIPPTELITALICGAC